MDNHSRSFLNKHRLITQSAVRCYIRTLRAQHDNNGLKDFIRFLRSTADEIRNRNNKFRSQKLRKE